MRSESESEPSVVEVKGGTAIVRANITTVIRADEGGKSRTVFQYDEVRATVDDVSMVSDLEANADALVDAANVSDSGTIMLPKGSDRMVIPHLLGVVPESVSAVPRSAIKGLEVFVSSDSIILVSSGKTASDINIDWAISGKGRELKDQETKMPIRLDTKALSEMSADYAAKLNAISAVKEVVKG